LVKSAEWLMKQKLIDKIEEAATLNLEQELEKIKAEVNSKIGKVRIKDAGSIAGKVNSIYVGEFKLSNEGIYIHVNTKGVINAQINKLDF